MKKVLLISLMILLFSPVFSEAYVQVYPITAYASRSSDNAPVGYAFDGDLNTAWNAGSWPPGWIEADLGKEYAVVHFELYVSQYPGGYTHHQILLSDNPILENNESIVAQDFTGVTADHQKLEFTLTTPIQARYVQIRTISSPSWLAWFEIKIFEDDLYPIDVDYDGIPDYRDNCPNTPNGPLLGTCTAGENIGNTCHGNTDCGTGGFCSMNQEDSDGNGIGDACDWQWLFQEARTELQACQNPTTTTTAQATNIELSSIRCNPF